jgi:hypothetical protein
MTQNVDWSSCKVPVIRVGFQQDLNLPDSFSKNTRESNFMKIRPMGADCHADVQTDRHAEAKSRFSQFCERA